VSRTPVREALDRLGALRLVESLPRRGTRVVPLDSDRHRQTLETLLPLVVESVRLAVEIADETQVRGLVARSSEDIPDPMTADGVFEYAIDLLGAGRVARAWRDLVPHVRRHWTLVRGPEAGHPG
jgi:hypothetical protein